MVATMVNAANQTSDDNAREMIRKHLEELRQRNEEILKKLPTDVRDRILPLVQLTTPKDEPEMAQPHA